ncbi:HesA/MoeB/ThiF family protein [Foetidibacter luteolus]|uniref:HesA/MoeB/ThiF family protein n=1 Tax=Foetidibacter luteolus TaxID=2608880 RepID=UPI00129AB3CF|nr:HesA/MoeB/ThiF family protein [Foetidibacter luteolus]
MQPDFLRYSCQIALPGFSLHKQQQLQNARVLIVGAGGLGCPAAQYLAAAGIGNIAIADDDTVSLSNLHRQVLYTPAEVGLHKAVVAIQKLRQQNPQIVLNAITERVTGSNAMDIMGSYDIVVDGTDNFDTRYLLNDACVLLGKPLVYGAIYQFEGQVAVWNIENGDGTRSINYRDVFAEVDASQVPNCAEGGVIPTLAGIIGCMQANEVIKYITGTGELLAGKMLMLDAYTLQSRIIKLGKQSSTNITHLPYFINVPLVTVEQLTHVIDSGIYELIDVRDASERATFHIGGRHIPLNELSASAINSSKPVLFYCASGKRSAEAAKQIKQQIPGAEVFSLKGGIKAWLELFG